MSKLSANIIEFFYLGRGSMLQAELGTILHGLRVASLHNWFPFIIESDFKITGDMFGELACDPQHPLFNLVASCKSLQICRIQHPWKGNYVADKLISRNWSFFGVWLSYF